MSKRKQSLQDDKELKLKMRKAQLEEEGRVLKKVIDDATKKYEDYRKEIQLEAFRNFEEKLTFESFYDLCCFISEYEDLQCSETLEDVGYKVPFEELKKIVEFIRRSDDDPKWEQCELSVADIVESHVNHSDWRNMSKERLEYLIPYLDDHWDGSFWYRCEEGEELRMASKMTAEELLTVFKILFKPKKGE